MIKKIIFFVAVFAFITGSLFLGSRAVSAQSIGVGVSPVKVEDIVDPGEVIRKSVKVTNKSGTAKVLYVYLRDFKAEGESGTPKLIIPGSEKGYFLASWIDITDQGVEFGPGEEKEVFFTINIPKDIGPGGYYGGIWFGAKPPKLNVEGEDKGAGMSIANQTGCLVLLQVSGDVIEEAAVREFSTDKNFYGTPFSVDFLLRIENFGNVHIKPRGMIKIKNMFGQEVADLRVNEGGGNVLPSSIRRFAHTWEDKNGFGKYKAELGLSYGTLASRGGYGKQSMFSVITFWIIPWRIIIPSVSGIIFIIALMFLFLKLYKNKAVRRAMEQAGMGHVRYVKKFEGPSPTLHLAMVLIIVLLVLFLVIGGAYLLFFA